VGEEAFLHQLIEIADDAFKNIDLRTPGATIATLQISGKIVDPLKLGLNLLIGDASCRVVGGMVQGCRLLQQLVEDDGYLCLGGGFGKGLL
jgi:hypothetical protein